MDKSEKRRNETHIHTKCNKSKCISGFLFLSIFVQFLEKKKTLFVELEVLLGFLCRFSHFLCGNHTLFNELVTFHSFFLVILVLSLCYTHVCCQHIEINFNWQNVHLTFIEKNSMYFPYHFSSSQTHHFVLIFFFDFFYIFWFVLPAICQSDIIGFIEFEFNWAREK